MDTTCGSYAFKGAVASRDADIIERAKSAGMIILAKTNMSVRLHFSLPTLLMLKSLSKENPRQELGSSKGFFITSGWSAVGGQV